MHYLARRSSGFPVPNSSPVESPPRSLEALNFERLELFLARLQGRRVPGLYRMIVGQVERALVRAALAQTDSHLGEAARLLDVDRNTLARKARAFGLPVSKKPGPKAGRRARTPLP